MFSWPIVERIPLPWGGVISPHGIGIGVGFLLAAFLFRTLGAGQRLRRDGEPFDAGSLAEDIAVRAAFGAIVVARLAYVATHLDVYLPDPLEILALTDGGFSFLGGLAGALLLCVPWLRRSGYDGLAVLDVGAAPVALGLLFGRLGDLTIGDHLGEPTSSWLGWRCTANLYDEAAGAFGRVPPEPYPTAFTPVQGCYDTAVVQTALVDGVVALVVLAVTLTLVRRGVRRGTVAAAWILTYAPLRVLGDVLREDRRFLGLTGSQWSMIVAFTVVVALLRRRGNATPEQVPVGGGGGTAAEDAEDAQDDGT